MNWGDIACIVATTVTACIIAVMGVMMRREHRQALAALARPVDGKPLSHRDRRILAQIEADSQADVPEPEYPWDRS